MASANKTTSNGPWTEMEHQRFLKALQTYRKGQWKQISVVVGTRTPNQTRTHGRKYFEKLQRWERGLFRRNSSMDINSNVGKCTKTKADSNVIATCEPIPFEHYPTTSLSTTTTMLQESDINPMNRIPNPLSVSFDPCVDWLLENIKELEDTSIDGCRGNTQIFTHTSPLSSGMDHYNRELKLSWKTYVL